MNVFEGVVQEENLNFEYPDEKIASNLYYVSLSVALRALDGMTDEEKESKKNLNIWLESITEKIHDVPVLDFDNITKKLANHKTSCDAFFYNFSSSGNGFHYLAEMKNAGKKEVCTLLEREDKDGIYNKVKDSVQMIIKQLEFGGEQEHENIIANTHLFIVYSGKNNMATRRPMESLKKVSVSRDGRGKQNRAGRMQQNSVKEENSIYEHFGRKIQELNLKSCNENTFPGNALPRARKSKKEGKQRKFSLFSAQDFAAIVDSGFFADWNWGSYQKYFNRETCIG